MNFRVYWAPIVEAKLAELWISSADRAQITEAANHIDQLLATSPMDVGESRTGDVRVLIEPPLTVYYTIDDAARVVTVKALWRRR